MSRQLLGMSSILRIITTTLGIWMLVFPAGCVMHENYGNHALTESERAVVEGYWHYRFLYDEELHIASVDGKREGGRSGWPYAYSVSLPSGRHWLQLAILRNGGEIARCAFEWTFEGQHRYKLQRLDHDQFLLAHPSSLMFSASLSMVATAPSNSAQHLDVSAVCGKAAMCRQASDCAPNYSCQMSPGFAFGICRPHP
jgi:hypothetical protein